MKAEILINSNYGFDHNWTLVVTNSKGDRKSFYLGQDVKFCSRVLGMSPSYVVEQIGSGDITNPKVNRRLAKFIITSLGLNSRVINKLNSWELCSQ